LALGFVNLQPDVNGYSATHVLAGVTWTISYEWAFYASLFVTAVVARSRAHLPLVAAALVLCLIGKSVLDSSVLGFAALFLSGMTVGSLLHGNKPAPANWLGSALALACLLLIFFPSLFGANRSGYGTVATLALAVFFYCVCSGATLFGLLATRAAQRLGSISYSVYLLQGIVLTLVLTPAPLRTFAMSAVGNYWLVGVLCACVLIAVAGLTFVFVEQPCIALGRLFTQRWLRSAATTAPAAAPFDAVPARRLPMPTAATGPQLHRRRRTPAQCVPPSASLQEEA
jgi:peptidoglycan/LPS O-acetylase OafA/YrhL